MTTQTADDVTQTTANNDSMSSSLRGIRFYFQRAVIVIGVVGTAANALILYALIASYQHKKHVLIFHQNVLDFVSSLLLVITSSLKLYYSYYSGFDGYWFCTLIESEYLIWVVILASKINLMFVTIERYLKVVHSAWSKDKLRNWMLYLAMALAWISGFVHMTATTFATTKVIGGVCYAYKFWRSTAYLVSNRVVFFVYFYAIILIIFIYCYGRILSVIRRQARVLVHHRSATYQTHSRRLQMSVIKTIILVSASFAICDLPINLHFILRLVRNPALSDVSNVLYYAAMFTSFLYICANPFIYATKLYPVRRVLLGLITCRQTPGPPTEGCIEMA